MCGRMKNNFKIRRDFYISNGISILREGFDWVYLRDLLNQFRLASGYEIFRMREFFPVSNRKKKHVKASNQHEAMPKTIHVCISRLMTLTSTFLYLI